MNFCAQNSSTKSHQNLRDMNSLTQGSALDLYRNAGSSWLACLSEAQKEVSEPDSKVQTSVEVLGLTPYRSLQLWVVQAPGGSGRDFGLEIPRIPCIFPC
jgi:hypothetical protein